VRGEQHRAWDGHWVATGSELNYVSALSVYEQAHAEEDLPRPAVSRRIGRRLDGRWSPLGSGMSEGWILRLCSFDGHDSIDSGGNLQLLGVRRLVVVAWTVCGRTWVGVTILSMPAVYDNKLKRRGILGSRRS